MSSPSVAPAGEAPLVSVVVPAFNRTRYLGAALESALGQTYRNIEILVSDDASREDIFGAVVARYTDPRVKYHRNPSNLGMGMNTWGALVRAGGKYVATLHDDDIWEPDFLETLVPPLERDESLSVAFCDHWIIDEAGAVNVGASDDNTRRWNRHRLERGPIRPYLEWAMAIRVVPAAMAALFRKAAIDWTDFPPEVGTFYDAWLTYLSARTGADGYYEPRRLTRYRVHQQSETLSWGGGAGRLRALRQAEFVGRRYVEDPALASIRPAMERDYTNAVLSLAAVLIEEGNGDEAATLLQRAHDLLPRPMFRLMKTIPVILPVAAQQVLSRFARRVRALLPARR
jgi:glycosyltransferase involved in cell wall biosynthesis